MPPLQHGKRPRGARVAKSTVTEKAWQAEIKRLSLMHGWAYWHFHDSRREVHDKSTGRNFIIGDDDAKSFPDTVLAHPRWGLAFVELKTDQTASKVRPDQAEALRAIAAGTAAVVLGDTASGGSGRIVVHVWRPRDMAVMVLPVLQGRSEVPRFYGFEVVG